MQKKDKNSDSAPDHSGDSIPSPDEVERILTDRGAKPGQVEDVMWLVDWARTLRINSFARLAKETGISQATISKLLRGKYEADLASLCATIANFRELWIERQKVGKEPWVRELSVVKRTYPFCDLVRATNQIGIIFGPNQSGKSKTLEHYAKDRKLAAYAKIPPGGATVPTVQAIARARGGISSRKRHEEMRDMILRRFNSQWILLMDEFHQTMKGVFKAVTIDRIREIHDDCNTPVILCGTDVIPEMMEDSRYKDFLGQIGNRGVLKMRIPAAPEPEDIPLLANAYGFSSSIEPKAWKIAQRASNENGISKLTDYFKVARQLAANLHERLTWEHFIATEDTLTDWAQGKFAESEPDGRKQLGNGSEGA